MSGPPLLETTWRLVIIFRKKISLVLPVWGAIGLVVYFGYSRSRSQMGQGVVEVVDEIGGEEKIVPIDAPKA